MVTGDKDSCFALTNGKPIMLQVKIWFQNHRYKCKRHARERLTMTATPNQVAPIVSHMEEFLDDKKSILMPMLIKDVNSNKIYSRTVTTELADPEDLAGEWRLSH